MGGENCANCGIESCSERWGFEIEQAGTKIANVNLKILVERNILVVCELGPM